MVPNGWSLKLISDTSKVITGNTPSTKIREYYGGNIPFVSPADLGGSKHISVATKKLTVEGFKKARSIRAGSTLFTCIGSTIGKLGMSATEVATNQQINAVVPYDKFDDDFIYYQLELRAVFIAKLAGTQAVPIINKTTFESQSLLVPDSLPEQRKIAKILSTWDKAISTTERLIDNSKQQKKALMQQLLTGKKRLLDDSGKPFEGEWEYVRAGDIFSTRSNKKHDSDLPILAITQDQGAIPREFIDYNVSVTKESISGYKVVENGDFIISLRSFQGGIEYSRYKGICSPAYVILYPKVAIVDAFYKYHLKSHIFIQSMKSRLEGIRDGKIISYKYFSEIKLPKPTLEEQEKIASVLSNADKEIELLEQQLADLKQEKKALMQQLLTGKRRVKVDDKEVA